MPDELRLFAAEGVLRPPGVPDTARPGDDRCWTCPRCAAERLMWFSLAYADCDCGYVWRRSHQLDHTEPLPF